MGDLKCSGCGNAMESRTYRGGPPKKYCSGACRQRALRRDKPEMMAAIAGRTALKLMEHRAAHRDPCILCGGPRLTAKGNVCGAKKCCAEAKRRRTRARYWSDVKASRNRVAQYRRDLPEAERLEAKRLRAAWARRVGYTASKRAGDARRRAAKAGVLTERFRHEQVFERDRWKCGICGRRIDRALAWPDPMSVSLDHVVPVSLGGPHTMTNTRAAHLTCNVSRSNARGETLQLALI